MPYLSLIILIIIDCRCQYSSFFSFSFLVLLKVFVNGGNDSRTHCSHNIFTMTACAMVTKSPEGKIEKTTVACVPFFTMGQKNNTSICLHNNSFFFFLKRYFLGFLLCINTITPDQRHFVLVTFFTCLNFSVSHLKLLICFATWCPSLHQCVFFFPFFANLCPSHFYFNF